MSVIKDANEIKFEDRPQHGNYCPKLFEKSWSPNRACTDAMKLLSSLIIVVKFIFFKLRNPKD